MNATYGERNPGNDFEKFGRFTVPLCRWSENLDTVPGWRFGEGSRVAGRTSCTSGLCACTLRVKSKQRFEQWNHEHRTTWRYTTTTQERDEDDLHDLIFLIRRTADCGLNLWRQVWMDFYSDAQGGTDYFWMWHDRENFITAIARGGQWIYQAGKHPRP